MLKIKEQFSQTLKIWITKRHKARSQKPHKIISTQVMLLQDTIGEHLLEVDKAAREREEVILKQWAE